MYKQVMILGLLLEQPMYGYQIREVIENHHALFADFIKKSNIYHHLNQMTSKGYLEVRQEEVETPNTGPGQHELALRERGVYHMTDKGRAYFYQLLREALGTHTPQLSDMDTCLFFVDYLEPGEAIVLLKERYELVNQERAQVSQRMLDAAVQDTAHRLVNDHKLTLLDAELNWLARTIVQLRTRPATRPATHAHAHMAQTYQHKP